ncbi:neutral/alkaline non-lysosomal ceramidase N-terminal domain-containing protein [Agriterribacter sp.]|uniref:neutral/alkaline non-lysosomal ceramidase N-terminal domain-containing protein n=1 Tax=Agriterribacter sp. TaxID=2821509 RepID=UPI002C2BFF7D|nr:neutral/alkaline non-lysosomal ceramidase N-terminal domain-containing protein [Agriterribacter sp.]HRP55179.1 neutral/alkaline non-lysosomal ceramidase N-terminal domain-containing protein [Agriterribacter sp.]
MKSALMTLSSGKNVYSLCMIFTLAAFFLPGKISFSREKANKSSMVDAGMASVDITPEFPIRMSGYAARVSTEADSVLQPISAKALALGSDAQHPSVLITVDLGGVPWRITKEVVDFLSKEKGIDPAQIAIYASHTHGGPEVGSLINVLQYRNGRFTDSLIAPDQLIHIAQYAMQLTQKLKNVAVAALNNRKPAYISWGQGQALFAANRRTKGGPVDVALPILKITDPDGTLKGVFVNYACHGTTLGGKVNAIHGDWISEAHRLIESRHPGATALIALGCAGDANPSPRGQLEHVRQHGKEIADNVDKLLTAQLQPLDAAPVGKMKWVKLPFSKVPDVPELIEWTKDKSIKGYYARIALEQVVRGEKIPATLDYPVQVWNFNNKMAMVNLGGEVVVDYSIRLKDQYGAECLWVNGYSNDVPCYIASRRIVGEGGYEGEGSMYWFHKPSAFKPEVEDIIVEAVGELMPAAFKKERPHTNRPELVQSGSDGSYRLSSWLAGTSGNRIKYMPEWKAFGWFTTKDEAIWKVDIAKSGKYDIYLDWSVSDRDAGKRFELTAGNKKIKARVASTGSWFTYYTQKIGTLSLSQGTETIVVKSGSATEEGAMFDLREVRLVPAK